MTVEVLVVGGGPAGAAVATHLARAGREVMLVERSPAYRWRAGGVFTSPAAVAALRRLGLDETTLGAVARPIPAMRVETPRGVVFRLTYGDDGSLRAPAVGLDRAVLDPALLALARAAGASVRTGVGLTDVVATGRAGAPMEATLASATAGSEGIRARLVVGADGIRSVVASSLGVARPARLGARIGLTFHLADPRGDGLHDARMCIMRDAYVGIAPVPHGRVNVGIVLGPSWRRAIAREGADTISRQILAAIPTAVDDAVAWQAAVRCDAIAGAAPIGHRVRQPEGPGWYLVGDAAGFLDPLTGEGFHRAIVSAELAAAAIDDTLAGRPGAAGSYERAMRAGFGAKDRVSWLVQSFLGRPVLFEYAARRLRDRSAVRELLGLVMGDLTPAARALDPRFLVALLAP